MTPSLFSCCCAAVHPGAEPDIESCPHVAYPLVNQDHRYDVGVACDPKTVRLAGGSARKLGVLQVYHDGQWGTVCDHGFGVREANVTCLQLGFDGGVVLYESALALGMDDTGPMWLDQVTCTGLGVCARALRTSAACPCRAELSWCCAHCRARH